MCSRYELLTPTESIVAALALRKAPTDEQARAFDRGEVRPTNLAPVFGPEQSLIWMPWGLHVDWQNQPVINARSETLEEKPTFRPLLQRRCLVPATAYFEWRTEGRQKIKTRIRAEDNVFTFAGLVGDGAFTIVTCAPSPSIAHIHDRMPVILCGAARGAWLEPHTPFAEVKSLLTPYDGKLTAEELTPPAPPQKQLALF